MAVTADNYGQGAVFGSLAYDFNNPELYREEYARQQKLHRIERAAKKNARQMKAAELERKARERRAAPKD